MSATYLFQLGSTPALSLAELHAVYPNQAWDQVAQLFAASSFEEELDYKTALYHLGGVVKLLKYVNELPLASTEEAIYEHLASYLITNTTETKLNYAIAEHGRDHLPALNPAFLKPLLKEQGISARFRDGSRSGLSAAILLHHPNVHELHLVQTATSIVVAETVAVQDIDEWSFRDREKPYADHKKGMLPPKVARIMVNLGLGLWKQRAIGDREPVVYDPFCGTGTVVMEAALAEVPVVASDSDGIAVHGTKKNLEWLEYHYHTEHDATVLPGDVATIQPKLLPSKVDLIVTEPFLGKPTPNESAIANIKRGLEKLYWGAFRNWTNILQEQGSVVIVLPVWATSAETKNENAAEVLLEKTWSDFLDKIDKLGYTTVSKPILYHRPQAIVQRLICQFTFKKHNTET